MYRFARPAALAAVAVFLTSALLGAQPAAAQSQDFFVPGQGGGGQARPAPSRPAPSVRAPSRPSQVTPQPPPPGGGPVGGPPGAAPEVDQQPIPQVQLPPVPDLPALPKTPPPPAPVIGVMGVPEVMRASTAAQQVEKIIGERREKLNQDAQKEQAAWREMQQALANDRGKLSPEQIRSRERELQDRITNAQKSFRDRNRIIQEAAQYALGQIERTLIAVIRQVAESRGMNLVLHRAQVALNVNEFDITDQVGEQLNKLLPSVQIPPDGVSPVALQQQQGKGATPAAAPPGAPPVKK
jgi:Skp family chaperone for outer membrane proteins